MLLHTGAASCIEITTTRMGGAASKQAVNKVATSAAKTGATAAAKSASAAGSAARMQVQTQTTEQAQHAQQRAQTAARIIQTSLSRRDLAAPDSAAPAAAATAATADAFRNPNAANHDPPAIMEMNDQLLNEMKRFEDFGKVEYLQQDLSAFESTASSYRPRSSDPIALPSDRTSNAASGAVIEHMPGRVTNREMRELLRLHYEDPVTWTHEALAERYAIDVAAIRNVLSCVGPPNVLKPLGPSEHPLGIWFDSPAAAARLTASQTTAAIEAAAPSTPEATKARAIE